jgi:hypothetical protein
MSAEDKTPYKKSKKLFFFEVDEYGTITVADFKDPKINPDIFDVGVDRLSTPESIISEIEECAALVEHFRRLAWDEHDELMSRIELHDHDDKELLRMQRLVKALEDEDDGWKEWIEIEGSDGVRRFEEEIACWLAAPIEWGEDMPDNATAQSSAKRFFEHEELATLDKLGVEIVEGEHPGSTYYAARLERKIEEANKIAQTLGLPYRFRREKESIERKR